jgi:ribosome maturation factor RimP
VAERVHDLLEPLAIQRGLEFVAAEVAGAGPGTVVRVYLDRDGGIDLDTLTSANDWIGDALESDPPVAGSYTLEVSSPGIERPLRRSADFERFEGHRAQVKTHGPVDGRKVFTGAILAMEEDRVVIDCEDGRHAIPLGGIAKANLKVEIAIDE